jgi:hypothetical protein
MDGTAREGLRPFSIITSSCIPDPLFFSFFLKRTRKSYTTAVLSFSGTLNEKKTKNRFHKRTDDKLTDFIK